MTLSGPLNQPGYVQRHNLVEFYDGPEAVIESCWRSSICIAPQRGIVARKVAINSLKGDIVAKHHTPPKSLLNNTLSTDDGTCWDKNVPLIKPVFFCACITDSAVAANLKHGIWKECVKQAAACP